MEPLRADFDAAKAAAMSRLDKGDADEARKIIKDFHHTLCTIRVLDPACGSGNFLYVAMDRMKRLEADVLSFLEDLGEDAPKLLLQGETIDPHQFLGIEINPWAVWAAELVLWIGFLQWHFKTFGKAAPSEPVLKDFNNIEKRDALLEWKSTNLRKDDDGNTVTREEYPNCRRVNWLGHYPRSDFSQSALYEIGSFITLFSVKAHNEEFLAKVSGKAPKVLEDDAPDDVFVTNTVSRRAEETTRDYIIRKLHSELDGYEFEYFVAHLLECMGYSARVSEKSGDGGVDVIAHTDELGFQPPIIKVQCNVRQGKRVNQKPISCLVRLVRVNRPPLC